MTPEDKETVSKEAKDSGVSVSSYIVHTLRQTWRRAAYEAQKPLVSPEASESPQRLNSAVSESENP